MKATQALRPASLGSVLIAAMVLAGCATSNTPPAGPAADTPAAKTSAPPANTTSKPAAKQPSTYSPDPGAAKSDPFGYDGRKWRRGLGS